MTAPLLTPTERRTALLTLASGLAGRARRARRRSILVDLRAIGAWLFAIDLDTPHAGACLDAASDWIGRHADELDELGA